MLWLVCVIDVSLVLVVIPGVLYVLPDSYVDPEFKDYGGKSSLTLVHYIFQKIISLDALFMCKHIIVIS